MVLVDTNILLRSIHPEHPHHAVAENAISALRLRQETLCLAPQNLVEFWVVATRPRNENGLGMSLREAAQEIASFRRFFFVLSYTPHVLDIWERLVTERGILGKQAHDAHLVAVMQANAVTSILTFNTSHFVQFPGVLVLDPAHV